MFDVVSETVSHYVSLGGPHYVNQADLELSELLFSFLSSGVKSAYCHAQLRRLVSMYLAACY